MTSHLLEITIAPVSPAAGKQVVELNLSHAAQILLIRRQGEDLQPTGSTQLQAGDRLLVQAEDAERERLEALFNPSPGTFPQPQGSDLQTNISDNQHTIDGP
jgi:Trk K+ transport system NAD-binding subunit